MDKVILQISETDLTQLLTRVEAGEEITLARGGVSIAKIVPIAPLPAGPRKPGSMKGMFTVGPEFFEPLPDDELAAWGQ
jgi:antitoxin (DNA-binding transcriptional repressor) of toxin-antitoxin stability system